MVSSKDLSHSGATSGEGENSDSPQYVTKEELNIALNGFRKSNKKDFESFESKLLSAISGRSNTSSQEDHVSDSDNPERATIKSLQAQLKEQNNKMKQLLDKDAAREQEARNMKLQNTVRDALSAHGITDKAFKVAYNNLKEDISYDEDGFVQMKLNDVHYPLKDALSQWVKTEDAKFFLPAKGTKGSGTNGNLNPVKSAFQKPETNKITTAEGAKEFIENNLAALLT